MAPLAPGRGEGPGVRGEGTLGFHAGHGAMPLHAPRPTLSTASRDREGAGAAQAACGELVPDLWP